MSYDVIISLHSSRFPEPDRLAKEVSARSAREGHRLVLPPSFDLRVAEGFAPLDSTGFGFEVMRSPITSKDVDDYLDICREDDEEPEDEYVTMLRESDTSITFCCKDNWEILVARLIGGALAKLSDGYVCDPQLGVTVRGGYLPRDKRADRKR